jgi:hypothetical protein
MEDKKLARDLQKNRPPPHRGRSDLYRYIRANMRLLTEAGFGTPTGPSWQELTARLNRAGQVNKHNQPLQLRGVISVFNRIRRDIHAEELAALEAERAQRTGMPNKLQPARAPKGWKPPIAATPATDQTGTAPFAPTANKQEAARPAGAGPRDMLAELWSDIDKRSGRN